MEQTGTAVDRLEQKSLDGQFMWELQSGFELSPRASSLILETVHLYYRQSPETRSGRVSLWVVCLNCCAGNPISELAKVQVWVTVDAGQEDSDAYERYGHLGLRRQKLLRISEEILEQGGVATQEDLSRLLGSSIRTVKRDIAYLRSKDLIVVTRGIYSDIGPSVSHKAVIVEMFLSGFVYTEICRRTRHSAKAVKRYVNTFGRVVALYERGIRETREIAHYVGISARLTSEYLNLFSEVGAKPGCRGRIEELLERLSSRRSYPGVDKSGMGKGGSK